MSFYYEEVKLSSAYKNSFHIYTSAYNITNNKLKQLALIL